MIYSFRPHPYEIICRVAIVIASFIHRMGACSYQRDVRLVVEQAMPFSLVLPIGSLAIFAVHSRFPGWRTVLLGSK